jgi:cation diffusion facilitator family transporter
MSEKLSDTAKVVSKVTWVGVAVNLFLSGIKLVFGLLFSSATLIADGVHSLSDLISDAAILIGVRFWSAAPDTNHPYGHGRIETLVTTLIAVLIGVVSFFIAKNAIDLFSHPQEAPGFPAAIAAAISIVAKELLFQWTAKKAKKVSSSALYANAWHHRSDALSSIPAFLAILFAFLYPNLPFIDAIGAIIVAAMLFVMSLKLLIPALLQLSDAGATKDMYAKIHQIAESIPGVYDAHAIRSRQIGQGYFIDLHIEVDPTMNVLDAHEISERVEQEIIKDSPNVMDVVVHIEPYMKQGNAATV